MISEKILLISSLVVASLVSSCSPGNSDNTAEIKAEPQTSYNSAAPAETYTETEYPYDPNGRLGFKPDAENFTNYLNSGDWGKGKEFVFSYLDKCKFLPSSDNEVWHELDLRNPKRFGCFYGFLKQISPVGEEVCELDYVWVWERDDGDQTIFWSCE